jgi:hypothetical protein
MYNVLVNEKCLKENQFKIGEVFNYLPLYLTRTLNFTGKNYRILHFTVEKCKTIYTIYSLLSHI